MPQDIAVSSEPNLQQDQQSDNLHVGLALLPDNLDIDPGFKGFINGHSTSQRKFHDSAEGTRLWSKHFAPLGSSKGIEVTRSWKDFFTNVLLHPKRFNWAKAFLELKAWEMTVSDKGSEMCFSFSIPASCPLKSPLGCSSSQNLLAESLESPMNSNNQDLLTPEKQVDGSADSLSTPALHLKRKKVKGPNGQLGGEKKC